MAFQLQPTDTVLTPTDSVSTSITDSTLTDQVLPEVYYVPLSIHNSIGSLAEPDYNISKYETTFQSGGDISELIADKYELNYLFPGQWSHRADLRMNGGIAGYQSAMVNGVQLFSPTNTANQINYFPVEQFENIEIYTGSKAAIFSENSTSFINYQTRIFNTATPYTQLSYFDAGESFISGEGIISQNILKDQNTTFGFKTFGGATEYDNQGLDHMNMFLSHRVSLSDLSMLSFHYSFINQFYRDNGGLELPDYSQPYAEPALLEPTNADYRFNDFTFRELNHILQIAFTGSITDDTTDIFSANVTYNYNDYQLEWQDSTSVNPYENNSILSSRVMLKSDLLGFETTLGGDTRLTSADANNAYAFGLSPFGYISIPIADLELNGGLRANISNLYSNLNTGANISYKIDTTHRFSVDASFNNINQINPLSNLESFTVTSSIGKYMYKSESIGLDISGYIHNYNSIASTTNLSDNSGLDIIGGSVGGDFSFGTNLLLSGSSVLINYNITAEQFSQLDEPSISAQIELFEQIIVQKSVARIGLRASFVRNQNPFFYDTFSQLYFLNEIDPSSFVILDAILMAKLGNANVRLIFENLLSDRYLAAIPYPTRGRNFRIHLSWAFPYN
jgi:hypothetical protein